MRLTRSQIYLLIGAFFILLPSLLKLYSGEEGRLIASTIQVSDPLFAKSVIYMHEHGWRGGYGVIVNRPLSPSEHLKLPSFLSTKNITIFYGGPAEFPSKILVMRRKIEDGKIYLDDFDQVIREEPDLLAKIAEDEDTQNPKYRIYAGYSGWEPLQLEKEFRMKGWTSTSFKPELVFFPMSSDPEEIWLQTLKAAEDKRIMSNPGNI